MRSIQIHTFSDFRRLCECQGFTPSHIATLSERIRFVWIGDAQGFTPASLLSAMEDHFLRYWEGRPDGDEKPLFLDEQAQGLTLPSCPAYPPRSH